MCRALGSVPQHRRNKEDAITAVTTNFIGVKQSLWKVFCASFDVFSAFFRDLQPSQNLLSGN